MQHFTFNPTQTPQSEPIPGREAEMVKNSAGGYTFPVDDWTRLDRFLVLGTEGGTYYASEQELSKNNCKHLHGLIKRDGPRVVARIVEISDGGRAFKNDPALFALALCATSGDEATKVAAYRALSKVARIGTHLFHWVQYVRDLGKHTGAGLRRAIKRWYLERDAAAIVFQAVKYQQRDGWSHRDLLRLTHPCAANGDQQAAFQWIVKGRQKPELGPVDPVPESLRLIWAFEQLKELGGSDPKASARIIADQRVPHEAVPNEIKDRPEVWEALLASMRPEAMLRNLNKMTAIGLLTNMSAATRQIVETFSDTEKLKKSRLHPMRVLIGLRTYQQGHGIRGSLSWQPVPRVCDALDKAFYLAFGAVTPTGKRMVLALDISGSMDSPVMGLPLSCREASAAMALVTMNVESNYEIIGFTAGSHPSMHHGYGVDMTRLTISPRQRLDDVCAYTSSLRLGGTDCALPMIWAMENKIDADAFCIYTDNETWAGRVQPVQALQNYRKARGISAKLVTVGMSATGFTIADPTDAGMLDCVGFDTATPNVIADFASH